MSQPAIHRPDAFVIVEGGLVSNHTILPVIDLDFMTDDDPFANADDFFLEVFAAVEALHRAGAGKIRDEVITWAHTQTTRYADGDDLEDQLNEEFTALLVTEPEPRSALLLDEKLLGAFDGLVEAAERGWEDFGHLASLGDYSKQDVARYEAGQARQRELIKAVHNQLGH